MNETEYSKLIKGIIFASVITLILGTVFVLGTDALMDVDTNAVAPAFQGVVITVQTFFGAGLGATILIWFRNTLGFIRAYLGVAISEEDKGEAASGLDYSFKQYFVTATIYVSAFSGLTLLLPNPYGQILMAIFFVFDLLKSEISRTILWLLGK